MNSYAFEFDLIKISLIFLISFGCFSLYVFRSFGFKNNYFYLLLTSLVLAFFNGYALIYYNLDYPNLIRAISLAIGPLLLHFIKTALNGKIYNLKRVIYNYIPCCLFLVLSIINFSGLSGFFYYVIVFIIFHFGIYLLLSINCLISRKVVVLRTIDSQNISSVKWSNLFNVVLTISFVYITSVIEVFTSEEDNIKFRFLVIAFVIGCLFLLIRNTVIKMLGIYTFYREKNNIRKIEKYKDSVLTKSNSEKLALKLEEIMKKKKPYLEESINSKTLSLELKTHPKLLSQVINENFHKNFFDYINSYRVEDAKIMLADKKYKDYRIYEIMYEVGFNSRSSFNTAFKKNTGITAKQFRDRNLYK